MRKLFPLLRIRDPQTDTSLFLVYVICVMMIENYEHLKMLLKSLPD